MNSKCSRLEPPISNDLFFNEQSWTNDGVLHTPFKQKRPRKTCRKYSDEGKWETRVAIFLQSCHCFLPAIQATTLWKAGTNLAVFFFCRGRMKRGEKVEYKGCNAKETTAASIVIGNHLCAGRMKATKSNFKRAFLLSAPPPQSVSLSGRNSFSIEFYDSRPIEGDY